MVSGLQRHAAQRDQIRRLQPRLRIGGKRRGKFFSGDCVTENKRAAAFVAIEFLYCFAPDIG